jgi:hypothetical protein
LKYKLSCCVFSRGFAFYALEVNYIRAVPHEGGKKGAKK